MAQCVDVVNLDGQDVLAPSPASSGACVTALVLTPDEYALVTANPFVLPLDGAAQISTAIALVWAVAWGFRAILKALHSDEKEIQP
ncbi:MAG: hypothetical protein JWQ04_92 [Pedosphaera sp.]|nr:hypothetical protein [Pedosphaera sp.]